MVDPYIGKQKRKRGESAVPEDRSPCCLMLVGALMVVAMIVGAAGAILIIDNPREAEDLRQTQTRLAVLLNQTATQAAILSSTPPTPIPSATRTASATPSASPTSRGLLNVTATRAATTVPFTVVPPPPGTIAASAGGPSEGFEFFARGSGFPRLAEPVNVTCSLTQTGFTLDFRQVAGVDNVYYFEVTLQANGDGAFLTEVSPLLPDGAVFPEEVILTVNDSSLAASELNPDETLITAYERILERERRITAFSVTWFNTARQPDLDFAVSGSHPNAGNVFMTIRWAFRADRPLESSGTFQVC